MVADIERPPFQNLWILPCITFNIYIKISALGTNGISYCIAGSPCFENAFHRYDLSDLFLLFLKDCNI